ncbi:MAG TPA: SAM-dependent methyltransferase, partial [Cellulomonadaceae bacterium]|nr:SAM-dependent methyltransferase [Cellulomonadaceae bacterium]
MNDLTHDPDLLARLRDDLASAGYTVAGVDELLGPLASAALHREEPVPARRATSPSGPTGADPRSTLVRAFVLGCAVTRRALEAALPRVGTAGAERLGLVVAAGAEPDDAVGAAVDLRPYAMSDGSDGSDGADGSGAVDWWIASDLGELATGRSLRTDHVLGVGGASTT